MLRRSGIGFYVTGDKESVVWKLSATIMCRVDFIRDIEIPENVLDMYNSLVGINACLELLLFVFFDLKI